MKPDAHAITEGLRCDRPGCTCRRPGANVHCPAHPDEDPSLSVSDGGGRVLVYCHAGCPQEAVIDALRVRGLWPREGGRKSRPSFKSVSGVRPLQSAGLTLEALAAAKKLPVEFLRSLGLQTVNRLGTPAVRIPYPDERGEVVAIRFRLSLDGAQRFAWRRGDRPTLYGLDRLTAVRDAGWVLLVEGESDRWTACYHGLPAIGIPGKGTWRREWAPPLKDLVGYIWEEPDAADLTERVAGDLPGLYVMVPPGLKDLSEAYLRGEDVLRLVERLRAEARLAAELLRERKDARLADLRRRAASVLTSSDPLRLVEEALGSGGYGGDLRPPKLVYLAATTRVLTMRRGAMPSHMNLVGPTGVGKNYTLTSVLGLLPPEAYHIIDAGSPRALIYDVADLRHRILVFGESDSLPAGEDNPAASAIRNLLQDHRLHYHVTVRDPRSGDFTVRKVEKAGPTVLMTTATRRLGEQLDSRLFTVEVPDDQNQVREALRTQAILETKGATDPPDALVAFQALLQALAPWEVVVPFAGPLAEAIGRSPTSSRVVRDFSRLLALIKAVTVLQYQHRRQDARGRLVAEIDDYATVRALVRDAYVTSVTGAGQRIRAAVEAVANLAVAGREPITVTIVAEQLRINLMAASRRVRAALNGGWLVNNEHRKGHPYRLALGDPLPSEEGLPSPDTLNSNTLTALYRRREWSSSFRAPGGRGGRELTARGLRSSCGKRFWPWSQAKSNRKTLLISGRFRD